jgi:signal transduction histidine kinase
MSASQRPESVSWTGESDPQPDPTTAQSDPKRQAWQRLGRYGRALIAPGLVWLVLVAGLIPPLRGWLHSEELYDKAALREWLEEARSPDHTLGELVAEYQARARELVAAKQRMNEQPRQAGPMGIGPGGEGPDPLTHFYLVQQRMVVKREEILQHLRALGDPTTKMYPGMLLLFPAIYRLEVSFAFPDLSARELSLENVPKLDTPVLWDSGDNPSAGRYREESFPLGSEARVSVRFQLHAWNRRQRDEQRKATRLRRLSLLLVAAAGVTLAYLLLVQADERERERQRRLAQEQIAGAERQLMQQERRHAETERQLLEQRLATQAAERQALELKSHLYASIGIMAGSYAHNIKNLLVRPNDLLRRCLESQAVPAEQERMIREVQQTLGTVTERLQQILATVRRDPGQHHSATLDLNAVVRGLARTWGDLAAERWQLDLASDMAAEPVLVQGDQSNLQQAIENLVFNARDATFEMRNHLREAVRRAPDLDPAARRQALIQAAAWRGKVVLRTRLAPAGAGKEAVLEVIDNGAGMTEEVRLRCTDTHFSTKRDNALHEGNSTGMGLGLSFVVAILGHHRGKLEIESTPLAGTTFRARIPVVTEAVAAKEK